MKKVEIRTATGKSVVYCEKGCFSDMVPSFLVGHRNFVLTDSNVYAIYRREIEEVFADTPVFVLEAGESSKTSENLFRILQAMIDAQLHRTSYLFALGGGVVGDIGGLAAALYMRGIHCVQIPTTLLAQVDSSVGGKTAVDMGKVKNVVGAFYQPEVVLVDGNFLKTLPERELRCGLGEIVKYGGLNGEILDSLTKSRDRLFDLDYLAEIVPLCIGHKAAVVEQDEKEQALRKSLNMGHTTAHALELCYGDRSHGEFVLIGMYYELEIALAEGVVQEEYARRLQSLIGKVVAPMPVYEGLDEAVGFARLDKKNKDSDGISLIVPSAYGEYVELTLPYEKYRDYLLRFASGRGEREEEKPLFFVDKPKTSGAITVEVPGSKSITNRALLLAALSDGECIVEGVLFSEDTRAFLSCLDSLGFSARIDEEAKKVVVMGMGGAIPRRRATIDVHSAGTAARFLTVFLAFAGGEYTLNASPQMEKRPMKPLIDALRREDVEIVCLKEEGHFPFVLRSQGIEGGEISVDTAVSSQFASALLMGAPLCRKGLYVRLTGERSAGSYIGITLDMMKSFGIVTEKRADGYYISPGQKMHCGRYTVEPDFSSAGYFFAAGALLARPVTVRGLHLDSVQGDKIFLSVLSDMGASVEDTSDGITVCGKVQLKGVSVNMQDFSDQALTLAAIAPFASSPVSIDGIGHIRRQECDRIVAIRHNLQGMGVRTEERADGVTIYPTENFLPCEIEPFADHRVAMAFAVSGLKTGNLSIRDPYCCRKTFENYFDVFCRAFYGKGERE